MNLKTDFMRKTFLVAFKGVPVTIKLTVIVMLLSLPVAFLMALKKNKKKSIGSKVVTFYVSFIRGVPVVLQILFVYSLLPSLLNHLIRNVFHLNFNIFRIDPAFYAYLVFFLNTIAVLTEVIRSALATVGAGQMEAALSIGMSRRQAYRRIIIPQAAVSALPNLCNATVSLLKNTSLAYMMTVQDITAIAKKEAAVGYNYIEAYLVIGLWYIILCTIFQVAFKFAEKSLSSYKKRVVY